MYLLQKLMKAVTRVAVVPISSSVRRTLVVKRLMIASLLMTLLFISLVLMIDLHISYSTEHFIFDELNDLPKQRVALVLGTSKYVGKRPNQFYFHRIEAAVALYKAGKSEAILVSGDNGTKYYNEPKTMQVDLLKKGIPQQSLTLDYAGFRTLDSIIRAKEVFDQQAFIIVSQRFHLQRALYIARHYGIEAIAYAAKDAEKKWHWRVRFRESFARVKMWLDLYVLASKPRFLGEKVPIQFLEGPFLEEPN